jgi:hypothetical protein
VRTGARFFKKRIAASFTLRLVQPVTEADCRGTYPLSAETTPFSGMPRNIS